MAEYTLIVSDAGGSSERYAVEAESHADALAQVEPNCCEWVSRGEWLPHTRSVDVRWTLYHRLHRIGSGVVCAEVEREEADAVSAE